MGTENLIEIHTLKWNNDHAITEAEIEDGDDANVTIYCRVFVGGVEIPQVVRARALFGQDFTEAVIRLIGPVEVINHTQESWEALDGEERTRGVGNGPVAGRFVLFDPPDFYITSWDTWEDAKAAFPIEGESVLRDEETGREWRRGYKYEWEAAST